MDHENTLSPPTAPTSSESSEYAFADLSVGDRLRCKEGVFTISAKEPVPFDETPDPYADAHVETPRGFCLRPETMGYVYRFARVTYTHAYKVKMYMLVDDGGRYDGEVVVYPGQAVNGSGFEVVDGNAQTSESQDADR